MGIMFHQLKLFVLCVAFCAIILFVSVIFLSNNDIFYMKNGVPRHLEKLYTYYDQKESYTVPFVRWREGRNEVMGERSGKTLVDQSPKYPFLRQQGLQPARKLPNVLLIGVKKGGTRALLEFIRLHPDVRAAGSEVHFFDRHYAKGYDWYRKNMPPTLEGQITIEKTPSYFVMREVPQRVYQMNPAMKLLVVVRDPVTRAISDYTQVVSKNVSLPKFEHLAFRNGSQFRLVDTTWIPIKIGVYVRHLERWLKYFPLKQFHFISGERLIVDPAAEIINVQEFLGLKAIISEKHFYFNTTKGFPCLKKSEGQSSHHCLGKTKGRSHPFIDTEVIERLREFYRPFNAKFYQITGVNFGWP